MRLFHRFEYQLPKSDRDPHLLFERAREVVRGVRGDEQPIRFYLHEVVEEGSKPPSAMDEALKRVPELAPYIVEKPALYWEIYGEPPKWTPDLPSDLDGLDSKAKWATNLQDWWDGSIPDGERGLLDADLLSRIAEGPSRQYRFHQVIFVFDGIDWLGTGEVGEPASASQVNPHWDRPDVLTPGMTCLRSCVIVDWLWHSQRRAGLHAIVEVDPSQPRLEDLPPSVVEALDRLGKRRRHDSVAAPSADEKDALAEVRRQAENRLEAFRDNLTGALEGIALPHALPPEAPDEPQRTAEEIHRLVDEGVLTQGFSPVLTVSESLTRALKPLGYRRDTPRCTNVRHGYVKRTAAHNQIALEFDVGAWGSTLSGHFWYRGPLWEHGLPFRFAAGQPHSQYKMVDQGMLDKLADNGAAIAAYLEAEVVPQLDELYGPAPSNWAYDE